MPPPLVHAIKFLLAHLYDNRSPVVIGATLNKLPFAVEALINRYKIYNT